MKFTKYVPEFVAKRKRNGNQVNVSALYRFARGLEKISAEFERRGREDATAGRPAADDDSFTAWGIQAFGEDHDFDSVVLLMKNAYMNGYNGGASIGK